MNLNLISFHFILQIVLTYSTQHLPANSKHSEKPISVEKKRSLICWFTQYIYETQASHTACYQSQQSTGSAMSAEMWLPCLRVKRWEEACSPVNWDVVCEGCTAYLIQQAVEKGEYISNSTQADTILLTEKDESTIDSDCHIMHDGNAAWLCLLRHICLFHVSVSCMNTHSDTASDGLPNMKIMKHLSLSAIAP